MPALWRRERIVAVDVWKYVWGGELDSEEISTVVLVTLWAFNDIYRNGGDPTEEQSEMFQTYMLPLIKNGRLFDNELLNAEVYRELGCFEECLKILADIKPADEFIAFIAEEIRKRAIREDVQVFKIEYIPQSAYQTKRKRNGRVGFWQKVKRLIKVFFEPLNY